MWLVFKLSLAAGAFLFRFISKFFVGILGLGEETQIDGTACFVKKHSNKSSTYATTYSFKYSSRAVFKLSRESRWDRLFKYLGLTSEFQTGDTGFDELVYIASDSTIFRNKVKADARVRELISLVFTESCELIGYSGEHLKFRFYGSRAADTKLMSLCAQLTQHLSTLDVGGAGVFSDRYALQVMAIEAVVWSLAAYAVAGFIEWSVIKEDVHVKAGLVATTGLLVGVALALAIFACLFLFLRKSSRGHRVLIESAVVLGLSLPVGGIQAVSDVNTQLDRGAPKTVLATITNLYEREHRGRRRRRWYSYHMHIQPQIAGVELPEHIRINRGVFDEAIARNSKSVLISVGPGSLGFAWYHSIRPM